jgi:modulator of FtsH protease
MALAPRSKGLFNRLINEPLRSFAMREQDYVLSQAKGAELEVSRVLRNTYGLLALTLAFSAVMAFVAQQMNVRYPNVFVVLIGFYGLFFLTNKLQDSVWGIVSTFALTGFMGYILGPILNRYLGMAGGAEIVSSAFAMTALVFGGLSAYVLITRKDMSFLSGFITAGFFVLLGATIAGFFFQISGLHLAISAGFVLFSSVCILFQTSAIIHGGERNYIMATVSLYVSIYNLFVSLLQLFGLMSRDD